MPWEKPATRWNLVEPIDRPTDPEPLGDRYPEVDKKNIWGNLAPSGRKLLFSDNDEGRLKLLDLETGRCETILVIGRSIGGYLRNATWSRDETMAAGWFNWSWVWKERKLAGVEWCPFVVDLTAKEITVFRRDNSSAPLSFIENPEVIEALKKRSAPWR